MVSTDNTDPSDRMIRRDQILSAQRAQQRQLLVRGPTHPHILFDPPPEREHQSEFFSTLLEPPARCSVMMRGRSGRVHWR